MNSVFDKPVEVEVQELSEGIAIVIDGDTAPRAIASGQFLYIKNHSTLPTGGYHATAAIASGDTISSSNVIIDADGIANAIKGNIDALNSNIANWENVAVSAGTNVTIYNTSVVKKNTFLKLVSVGIYLPISGAISSGSVLLSGLPVTDGNGNFEAVNYKADTSKFANAVYINSSGELITRENISSGDTIMLTIIYKMV